MVKPKGESGNTEGKLFSTSSQRSLETPLEFHFLRLRAKKAAKTSPSKLSSMAWDGKDPGTYLIPA